MRYKVGELKDPCRRLHYVGACSLCPTSVTSTFDPHDNMVHTAATGPKYKVIMKS